MHINACSTPLVKVFETCGVAIEMQRWNPLTHVPRIVNLWRLSVDPSVLTGPENLGTTVRSFETARNTTVSSCTNCEEESEIKEGVDKFDGTELPEGRCNAMYRLPSVESHCVD